MRGIVTWFVKNSVPANLFMFFLILGEVEVYDKEAFFGALDKKADKVKKRTLSKAHLKKMMDGKKKANS